MNKTVTINISGIIFHIEEDAYEKLSKYLNTIKGYFSDTDGGNEIMGDIEARIAEMLQAKTSNVKQVVLMADVDAVIETMGKPEEFAGESSQEHNEKQTDQHSADQNTSGYTRKRMFRDPDNKAIGGVCSGIAAYFDTDIVWIRLAMILLIFVGGVSFWVYIILWIVIPEAKTTADKLSMRGEKIDINNISKTVMEEAEQLRKRMEKYGSNFTKNNNGQPRNLFDKLGDFLKDFIIIFTKFFARIIGLILLIFGISFMFGLMSTIFGFSVIGSNTEYNDWVNALFLERGHYTLGIIGISLVLGIPVLLMIYGGIKLLFRIKYSNRWLNFSAGVIWVTGLAIAIYTGIKTGSDFSEEAKVRQEVQLTQHDTLYLTSVHGKFIMDGLGISEDDYEDFDLHGDRRHRSCDENNDYVIAKTEKQKYILHRPRVSIVPSLTDKFELFVVKKARGEDQLVAASRAKVINYKVTQKDSTLLFDELLTVEGNEKFRVQEVNVILKVPNGKVIHLDKNMQYLICGVENVTDTYDGDMVSRRWKMTKEGLECIDCDGLELRNHDDLEIPAPPAPPAPPDVHVSSNDANVKINEDGIKVKSKDADVEIGKNGIHIDTKGPKEEKGEKGSKGPKGEK